MIYQLYKAVSSGLKPLLRSHLRARVSKGKEDPARLSERYGVTQVTRPTGPLLWFHAASVGESLSILPLIHQVLETHKSVHILVTTGTKTSAVLMGKKLPNRCIHQYIPLDVIDWVRAFHDHWRPDLAIFVESEFWPNLLRETNGRKIPMVLLNASLSEKSFNRWKVFGFLARQVLNLFDLIIAQSRADQDRLDRLGAEDVLCYGNLKFAAAPLPHDSEELVQMQEVTQGRPLWLAASTHPGEEEVILETHTHLLKSHPDLLTIVVPRHPERGVEVQGFALKHATHVGLRSGGDKISAQSEVYIADTLGELGLFYRLSPISFVGGSLGPVGGHNLIEPAQLDCAVLHGHNMANQQEMADLFLSNQASLQVTDAGSLSKGVDDFLKEPTLLKKYSENAKTVADSHAKIIDQIFQEMAPYLGALEEHDQQRASILV